MSRDTLTREQIEETFRMLGLNSDEARARFVEMGSRPQKQRGPAGHDVTISDNTKCDGNDAELERDSQRNESV